MIKYAMDGVYYTVDPQVIGERLTFLAERDGFIKPDTYVKDATPEDSPLHATLEWDDSKAAHRYRLSEASKVIRCIRIVKGEDSSGEPILERPFIRIIDEKGEGFPPSSYFPTAVVMSGTELRQAAISDAMTFLSRAKNKLKEFRELETQYKALEKIEGDLVAVQMKLRRSERARETVQALQAV